MKETIKAIKTGAIAPLYVRITENPTTVILETKSSEIFRNLKKSYENNVQLLGDKKDGVIDSGDLFDTYGLQLTGHDALTFVLDLLKDNYDFDIGDYLELIRFANSEIERQKVQLEKQNLFNNFKQDLTETIENQVQSASNSNMKLRETYDSLNKLFNNTATAGYPSLSLESNVARIDFLEQVLKQNQEIYNATITSYNDVTHKITDIAFDIEIIESWISTLLNRIKNAINFSTDETDKELFVRSNNKGHFVQKLGGFELSVKNGQEKIEALENKAQQLIKLHHNNQSSKNDSFSYLHRLINKFKGLLTPAEEEIIETVNKSSAKTPLASEEHYFAFRLISDVKKNFGNRENPLIQVFNDATLSLDFKLKVLDCLIDKFKYDINNIVLDQSHEKTIFEYFLSHLDTYSTEEEQEKDISIIEHLISKGANLGPIKPDTLSPLHYLAKSEAPHAARIMDVLIENGADANYQPQNQEEKISIHYGGGSDNEITLSRPTPLAVAVINPCGKDMIASLLKNGANGEVKTQYSKMQECSLVDLYYASITKRKERNPYFACYVKENEQVVQLLSQPYMLELNNFPQEEETRSYAKP